jgi:hypothetical protein
MTISPSDWEQQIAEGGLLSEINEVSVSRNSDQRRRLALFSVSIEPLDGPRNAGVAHETIRRWALKFGSITSA